MHCKPKEASWKVIRMPLKISGSHLNVQNKQTTRMYFIYFLTPLQYLAGTVRTSDVSLRLKATGCRSEPTWLTMSVICFCTIKKIYHITRSNSYGMTQWISINIIIYFILTKLNLKMQFFMLNCIVNIAISQEPKTHTWKYKLQCLAMFCEVKRKKNCGLY